MLIDRVVSLHVGTLRKEGYADHLDNLNSNGSTALCWGSFCGHTHVTRLLQMVAQNVGTRAAPSCSRSSSSSPHARSSSINSELRAIGNVRHAYQRDSSPSYHHHHHHHPAATTTPTGTVAARG
ncbi:hypothetical protein VYU27_003980 [Nannochloropsis oceanica]